MIRTRDFPLQLKQNQTGIHGDFLYVLEYFNLLNNLVGRNKNLWSTIVPSSFLLKFRAKHTRQSKNAF